ncbi:MAG TPA: YhdP family protein [Steroidobacteraceae bacterium]|nr:YhdP family protein [Steroidobacteraceae bacterium]
MSVRKAGKILLYCVAGLLGLLLLLMLAVKIVLDRAPAYQAEIQQWLHAQTGYHITFAGVSPSFRWYGPELHFERLELRSKDDARVLARAAGGRVAADIWQLISSGKLLAGRIELDSPSITITRLEPTSFALASEIKLGGNDSSLETLTLDDLPAGKLAIRHALVTMQKWNSALPQLELRDVNLDVRRGDESLSVVFNAHLPPALGGVLSISGNAHGLGRLDLLDWTALAWARDISFPGWRLLLPEFLSRLDAGSGAFDLAARGTGRVLTSADLDFAAQGVVTQLSDGPSAKFEQIGGALRVLHAGDRWSLTGARVRAVRSGRRDPESEFDVSWRGGETGLLDFRAHATYLRADTLLPLSGLLPEKAVRDRLQEIAPTGEWMNTVIALTRATATDRWQLQVQANFRDVGFAPVGRSPGLRGLTGTIGGTESGGHVTIDTHSAVFSWPTQFSQPVSLETLKATLYWKRTSEELLVASPDWTMNNRDAAVQGKAAWTAPADGSSPLLTLVATVENGNAANARNYFPRERIAPPALAWLDRAFVAGHLSRANVVLRGPMRHFPFRDGSGLFLARCALDGLTLDYSEGWPRAENLAAHAEFRNEGMTAHLLSGRVGGFPIDSADARFADFKTGELELHVRAGGDAGDALTFLRASPLDASAEHAFSGVEAKGPMQSKVDLFFPFKDFVHRRVLVHGRFEGVTLGRPGSTVAATDLNGDFDVDGAQVAGADVRGRILGGTFQMQARTPRNRPLTRTQLEFRGTLNGDALRAALALPAGIAIGGETDWRASLKMAPEPNRERSLRVSSSLVGLEMKLPAPLDKAADTPMPSWFDIQWPAAGGPFGRLALGSVVSGSYALESNTNAVRLARLALSFGASEPDSDRREQNFNVGGSVARLDLAGWLNLNLADKNAKPASDYLRTARLTVAELDYLGLAFRDVTLDLAAAEGGWRITVGGPNVVGTITLPAAANLPEPWNLQFERLRFAVPSLDGPGTGSGADGTAGEDHAPSSLGSLADPHGIPPINFHAADLTAGERHYGDVQATLLKLDDGISLEHVTVTNPSFTISAQGDWRGKGAGSGRIVGTLISNDVQNTLQQLGYAEVIEAKTGRMDFDLSWLGAPTADALSGAAGRVQLSLDKGQIAGIKPGAGRVLGLASIAALPRRLALDFSDLTDKGLAFDTVRGDFDLRDGNAYTEDVLVKGPAAEIGLIGRVGLKNKDYDQTAVVTGSLGSSPLPLAGFVGGPVLGAAVLVFTQVFKQPLKGLARGYYRITGSWDNPTVERIKGADAAAATAEAPK